MMPARLPARPRLTAVGAAATAVAALCLWPLIDSGWWYPPAVGAVMAVGLLGWLARSLRFPLLLTPLLEACGAVLVLMLILAPTTAIAGLVPTPDSLDALRALLVEGLDAASAQPPPLVLTPAVVALAAGGVALIAVLVDTLLVALRSGALAGLPLLVLFLVPVAVVPGGAAWWCVVPPAIAWMAVLAADARSSVSQDAPRARPRLFSPARAAGALALVGALLVALVVPALSEPRLGRPGWGDGPGTGAVSLSPLASLKRDYLDAGDREVLTVSTDARQAPYLRLAALEYFDGTAWSAGALEPSPENELNAGLPTVVPGLAGQSSMEAHDYTVRVGALEGPLLPQPVPAVEQTIGGGWYVDPASGTVFSDQFSSAHQVYTVTALDTGRDAARMRALARTAPPDAPQLPAVDIPPMVTALARQVTAGTDNSLDAGIALQEFFRENFEYSTAVSSGSDTAYLEQFLRDRVGYCEQFAATMALMARAVGIPARVAVGFAPGRRIRPGTYSVSSHDAHAWPELWIAGSGWTRFEPTPRSGDGSAVRTPVYAPDAAATSSPDVTEAPEPSRNAPSAVPRPDGAGIGTDSGGTSEGGSGWWWLALAVVLLAAALLVLPLVRAARRRRRLGADDARAVALGAWADLRDSALDAGRPMSEAQSPREAGRTLVGAGHLDATASAAVGRIVDAAEWAAYRAPGAGGHSARDQLRTDLRTVRRGLRSGLSARSRWRAVLAPASCRTTARRGGGSSGPRRGS